MQLGRYLTLENFCTCTQTYQKYQDSIDPYPRHPDTIQALKDLNQYLLDPIITHFGQDQFRLTYGFCSADLKKFLAQKDPVTGQKNGRVDPSRDQHLAHEVNRNGKYYCGRLGAASDFLITHVDSDQVVEWILKQQLPFDSLYYYGKDRPIHLSYGHQHKRDIWTFTPTGQPTRKGIQAWIKKTKP
jgi:hypothetical protein